MIELHKIQLELNAPKNLYNSFGKYAYRSAEGILEAVKPLLKEYQCELLLSDEVQSIGDRNYVKATATLINSSGESRSTVGYAREDETKKGMDGAQITGACSSYARKYALNGLFAIDDNKDPDTDEHKKQQDAAKPKSTGNPRLDEAINKIKEASNRDELLAAYNTYVDLKADAIFSKHLSARKKALGL